jgi:bifunctional lysine-specific demethylase and histidyl-hydroxylase MINA
MDMAAPRSLDGFGFADLLAPLGPEEFARDVQGKKPVHVPGASPDKFAFAMSWDLLNGLLDQSGLWTPQTLNLALDKTVLPVGDYTRDGVGRDGRPMPVVDFDKVRAHIARGASLVLNEVETLTPGMKRIAEVLAREPGGKVQANLYCSWRQRQAFDVHFDTHDVFAMQIAGEKVWRIYQRHFKDPINHPAFKQIDQRAHEANKGALLMEVTMRPGDLIYIPRGFYHEALAETGATVHVSFSVVTMIGLDVISLLFEHAVRDEVFRATLPQSSVRGGAALDEYLMRLAGRLREILRDPKMRAQLDQALAAYRNPVQRLKLPDDSGV